MYSEPEWDYYIDSLLARRERISSVRLAGSLGAGWTSCHRNADVGIAIKASQQGALAQLVTQKTRTVERWKTKQRKYLQSHI